MSNLKIMGPALPDMPWEERPAGKTFYCVCTLANV